MTHTPGTWKRGINYGSIVSDETDGKLYGGADATEHYGGYLIAESIAEQNRPIIAAAPDMLAALKNTIAVWGATGTLYGDTLESMKRAIAKAEGKSA